MSVFTLSVSTMSVFAISAFAASAPGVSASWKPLRMKSANAAIGAAVGFAALSAGLALLPERAPVDAPQTWALRGTIQPSTIQPSTIQPSERATPAVPQRQARL